MKVRSIGHLKELCQKRDLLFGEDSFRRSHSNRNAVNFIPQRRIAAMESQPIVEENMGSEEKIKAEIPSFNINAISSSDKIVRCWNCEEEGHFWDMCLKERKIFCYGCGLRNVYKPQCLKCANNTKNLKNYQCNNNYMKPK